MIEIRFHGRGGQGAVTAAELLAVAVGEEGKSSQAFPFFGVERRGAPVKAFCRIDDKEIIIHEQVYNPDIVVVLDATLIEAGVNVLEGIKPNGVVVVNSPKPVAFANPVAADVKVFYVDATSIAHQWLGVPIVNTAMLGALVKATNVVKLESLTNALEHRFGAKATANIDAVKDCFEKTIKV
ncbi:MAG: pyruvate ferredoxin oxidoreductase subunit gamma [Candidatus Micrarchaeota archaeon]